MVRELKRLFGRVEVRVLLLLACGVLLTSLALSVAHSASTNSAESYSISSWNDLRDEYLGFRERSYPLVVPTWFLNQNSIESTLDEFGLDALQEDPNWYWTLDGGVIVFADKSPLSKQIQDNTEVLIYEDVVNEEILILSIEGETYQEEIVYRAPKWPRMDEDEDYEAALWRELAKRRISWRVTLKSEEQVAQELEEAQNALSQPDLGGGGMMMAMGGGGPDEFWLSIRGPAQGITGIQVVAHLPIGATNRIEFYSFSSTEGHTFNGLAEVWKLEDEDLFPPAGTNEVVWSLSDLTGVTNLFASAGNGDIDTDFDGLANARELFVVKTNPDLSDTDSDGVNDGNEVDGDTDPNNPNDPPNVRGAISYSGQQTNVIHVVAVTDSNSWALTHSTTITEPGDYQISSLPASNYWVKAFRDLDSDSSPDSIEASGAYVSSPVLVTGQVSDIDITLTELDTDSDGFTDYEEIVTGGDPYNETDGHFRLREARLQITEAWSWFYSTPLVFTNEPGSPEDLQNLDDALLAISSNMLRQVEEP